MPVLTIRVKDLPREWEDYRDLELVLQTKKEEFPPVSRMDGSAVFEVQFEEKDGQPSGPTVWRGNDGKRFVYLRWYGMKGGVRESFRRIKVYFEDLPEGSLDVSIPGRDPKGGPSCARVRPVAP